MNPFASFSQDEWDHVCSSGCTDLPSVPTVPIPAGAGNVTITVSDEGRGFEGDDLDALKRRFGRGGNVSDVVGSGLGLTIADEVVHAFAISVHKSQGSEFPAVVLPMMTQHYLMLQRNLLYTAVTRAKQKVILVGQRRAIAIATRNNRVAHRHSGLSVRLTSSYNSLARENRRGITPTGAPYET